MEAHNIQFPREVLIGDGALGRLGEVSQKMRLSGPCLVITGRRTREVAGDRATRILEAAGYVANIEITDPAIERSELDRIAARAKGFRFVVGVGGGRVIDTAKYCSFKAGVPFLSVPTAPSHDGIASPRASIESGGGHRLSVEAHVPLAIICDLDIIAKTPYRMIGSGCADTISNMIAVEDWKLGAEKGEFFSDYAASMSVVAANMVTESAKAIRQLEKSGLKNLLEALIASGTAMCIAGSSRPASGSEHLFSHTLDMLCPQKKALHGEQCGVGSIAMAYLHRLPWEKIQEALKSLGCPTNAEELGVPDDIVVEALVKAPEARPERFTILHRERLDAQRARELAKTVGII